MSDAIERARKILNTTRKYHPKEAQRAIALGHRLVDYIEALERPRYKVNPYGEGGLIDLRSKDEFTIAKRKFEEAVNE